MVLADSRRISRVLRYLGVQTGSQRAFVYRTFTFFGPTSQTVRLACWFVTPRPCGPLNPATPLHASVLGFRLFPVRSPLLGESNFLSFPVGTEMSHFPPLASTRLRSEEHTSELQSLRHLVCRLLLEKKNHT